MPGIDDTWLQRDAYAVLEPLDDAVLVLDDHGLIQYSNSAAFGVFGYLGDELVRQPLSYLLPQQNSENLQNVIGHYPAEPESSALGAGGEVVARDKQGRLFPIYFRLSEVSLSGETWFVGVAHKLGMPSEPARAVVEQRRRYARINRLSTLGAIMANVAHEVNQPLAAVALYAQTSQRLLQSGTPDKDKLASVLDRLTTQALRASEIIERIRKHLDTNFDRKKFTDLNSVIEEVLPLLSSDVRASGLKLEHQLLSPGPVVCCEPIQIQQVMIDLVRNAVDAIHEVDSKNGQRILIRCDDHTLGFVTVSVVDCGVGLPESLKDEVFEAFRSTKPAGTGMGLPVSRSIIEQHEGTLKCENNENYGATFAFRLPTFEKALAN